MIREVLEIIKLEIRYFRILFSIALVILLGIGIVYAISGTYRAIISAGTVLQIVVLFSMAVTESMDKRSRLYVILPIRRISVALNHSLPVFTTGLVLLLIWIGLSFFAHETPPISDHPMFIMALIVRFLINTVIFQTMILGFELADRKPWVGIPLITMLGMVIGYSVVKILERDVSGLGVESGNIIGGFSLPAVFLLLTAIMIALYIIDVIYAYYSPLNKYCMK